MITEFILGWNMMHQIFKVKKRKLPSVNFYNFSLYRKILDILQTVKTLKRHVTLAQKKNDIIHSPQS